MQLLMAMERHPAWCSRSAHCRLAQLDQQHLLTLPWKLPRDVEVDLVQRFKPPIDVDLVQTLRLRVSTPPRAPVLPLRTALFRLPPPPLERHGHVARRLV